MSVLGVDAELFAILVVLVGLDALKRVQADTVVFRRVGFGAWRAGAAVIAARWVLLAPLTPAVMAVAAPARGEDGETAPELVTQRHQAARPGVRVLRLLGAIHLVVFVIGVPVGVARWSGIGLLAALGVTLGLGSAIALTARAYWRMLPGARGPRAAVVLTWLSPFSTAAAAQDLLHESLRGATVVQVAHLLLAPGAFRAWVRPLVYDAMVQGGNAALEAVFPGAALHDVIDAAPVRDADAATYCPRCGQTWRQESGSCPSCETVPLARWVVA